MLATLLLTSSLLVSPVADSKSPSDDSHILHCRPLPQLLSMLNKPKYKEYFGTVTKIIDEEKLKTIQSLYNYMSEDENDEEPPKWTLAVLVEENKGGGGVLMVGFRSPGKDVEGAEDEEFVEGVCRTIHLSKDGWSALDNELNGKKS